MSHSILIVDDEDYVRKALNRTLRSDGYEILEARSGEEGLQVLRDREIDVVMSDHKMPGMSGIDFLRTARLVRPDSLRMILTGQADLDMCIQAINEDRVYRFLLKPWDGIDLRFMMRLAVRQLDTDRANARLVSIVREQAEVIRRLEMENPGISSINRDRDGTILLDDTLDA